MFTRIRTLATAFMLTLAFVVGGAAAATASDRPEGLPSKSERAATRIAWHAEQAANRECGYPTSMPIGEHRWERCVKRAYKRITGERMQVTSTQCHRGKCGLHAGQAHLYMPGRSEAGADAARTLGAREFAQTGIPAGAYGRPYCRAYTHRRTVTVMCSNGYTR